MNKGILFGWLDPLDPGFRRGDVAGSTRPVLVWFLVAAAVALAACQSTSTARRSAHQDSDTVSTYIQLGLKYMQQGNLDVALGRLQHAVKLDPASPTARDALGTLYQRLGDTDKAEQAWRKALNLRPDYARASNNYGRFLCRQERYEAAAAQFQKAYANPLYARPWLAYTNAGICSLKQRDYAEAERLLRSALQLSPRFAPALRHMVQLGIQQQKYLSVRAYLQRYLEVARHTPQTLWAGIRAERELRNLDVVASYALLLRAQFPDSFEAGLLKDFEGR